MKISDSILWGLRGIRQRKLRAALTILGILVGTAAVIALVSQTQGIQTSIIGQMDKLGPTAIIVRPGSSNVILTQSDVGVIGQIPGIVNGVPIVMGQIRVFGKTEGKSDFHICFRDYSCPIIGSKITHFDYTLGYRIKYLWGLYQGSRGVTCNL
jgi:ABC-type lipoprotein release transport system permease subunit